jgi:hypothetical protein
MNSQHDTEREYHDWLPRALIRAAPTNRLAPPLDIQTMDKGGWMLKMNGFDVPGVIYFHPDVPVVLTGNSHECR